MKVCEKCCGDIDGARDGENMCAGCDDATGDADPKAVARQQRAKRLRRERDDATRSLGLVKVKGAMGGTYWE